MRREQQVPADLFERAARTTVEQARLPSPAKEQFFIFMILNSNDQLSVIFLV